MDEQNKQQTKKQKSIIQEKTTEKNGKDVKVFATIAIVIIIATIGILIWQRNADTERNEGNSYVLKIETPYLSGQGVLYSYKGENAYILTAGHMMLGMNIGTECDVTFGVSGDT